MLDYLTELDWGKAIGTVVGLAIVSWIISLFKKKPDKEAVSTRSDKPSRTRTTRSVAAIVFVIMALSIAGWFLSSDAKKHRRGVAVDWMRARCMSLNDPSKMPPHSDDGEKVFATLMMGAGETARNDGLTKQQALTELLESCDESDDESFCRQCWGWIVETVYDQ